MKRKIAAVLMILMTLSMPVSHFAVLASEPDTETVSPAPDADPTTAPEPVEGTADPSTTSDPVEGPTDPATDPEPVEGSTETDPNAAPELVEGPAEQVGGGTDDTTDDFDTEFISESEELITQQSLDALLELETENGFVKVEATVPVADYILNIESYDGGKTYEWSEFTGDYTLLIFGEVMSYTEMDAENWLNSAYRAKRQGMSLDIVWDNLNSDQSQVNRILNKFPDVICAKSIDTRTLFATAFDISFSTFADVAIIDNFTGNYIYHGGYFSTNCKPEMFYQFLCKLGGIEPAMGDTTEVLDEDCYFITVKGTYYTTPASTVLKEINRIRKEACDKGYPDPRDKSRKLVPSDYHPVKWSASLEKACEQRAAEAALGTITLSHNRPKGEYCWSVPLGEAMSPLGGGLAWNYSTSGVMKGISQFYEEKDYWVKQTKGKETGHYTHMINPDARYVGFSAFLLDSGGWTATAFWSSGTEGSFIETQRSVSGKKTVEIPILKSYCSTPKLSGSATIEVPVGGTKQISATTTAFGYTAKLTGGISWKSDDESIATIDTFGVVTGISGGTTTVSATIAGKTLKKTIKVVIPMESISLNDASTDTPVEEGYTYTLNKGDTMSFTVQYHPENTTDSKAVTWTNGNKKMLKLATAGDNKETVTVEAIAPTAAGKTVSLTATASKKKTTVNFIILSPMTGISLNKSTLSLDVGKSQKLSVSYLPSDTTDDRTVTWSSDNEDVATVDTKGTVKITGKGTAIITATVGTFSAECEVTGTVPLSSVKLSLAEEDIIVTGSVEIGESAGLIPAYTPENATVTGTTWTSSDKSIATVDENGRVTGVKKGTVTIKLTAASSGTIKKTASFKVNIIDPIIPAESVILDQASIEVENGFGSITLAATVLPEEASSHDVIWSSADESIATVDPDGTVKGTGVGTTVIRATAKAKPKVGDAPYAECTVTVKERVTYYLYFDTDGGILPDDMDYTLIVYNQTVGELPVPKRAGRIFDGWIMYREDGREIREGDPIDTKEDRFARARWILKYQTAAPVADPGTPGGTATEIDARARIKLTSTTEGSTIYYKKYDDAAVADADKSAFAALAKQYDQNNLPNDEIESSGILICDDAITIDKDITILAIAMKEDFKDSDVVRYSYTLRDTSEDWGDLAVTGDKDLFTDPSSGMEDRNGDGQIDARDIPDALWVTGISDFDYDGTARKQTQMRVYHHTTLLAEGKDYAVKYTNNKNAGTATMTITGKKNYKGTLKKTFTIRKISLDTPGPDIKINAPEVIVTYNGKVQKAKPVITVEVNGRTVKLKAGTDFACSYPGTNSKSSDYDATFFKDSRIEPYGIIVTGKGKNFEGSIKVNERITGAKVASKLTIVKIPDVEYDGFAKRPAITVRDGKKTLTAGVDYEVITDDCYSNNIEIGTATVTITGIEDKVAGTGYVGTKTATFRITGTPLSKVQFTDVKTSPDYDAGLKGFPYTGLPYEPAGPAKENDDDPEPTDTGVMTLTNKTSGDVLERGKDYTVTYKNNTNAGTATIFFTGMGYYYGTVKKTFAIRGYHLTADEQSAQPRITVYWEEDDTIVWEKDGTNDPSYDYEKGGVKPEPVVKYVYTDPADPSKTVERILVRGTDYQLTYKNHNGTGDKDSVSKKGKSTAPTVTIKGLKAFSGTISRTYTIRQRAFDDTDRPLKVSATDIVWKNKNNICKPKITVTDINGVKLTAGTDYEKTIRYTYVYDTMVDVKNGKSTTKGVLREGEITPGDGDEVQSTDIIPAGTVIRATVTGKGNYAGDPDRMTISTTFRIVKADIGKATIKVVPQEYGGGTSRPDKTAITVKIDKTTLSKTDYEIVSYTNNEKAGTAKITLRGTGNYGGTKTVTFKITALNINGALIF